MAEHTQGPWEAREQIDYDQAGNKFIDGYAVFNKDGLLVAANLSKANANFLAAAPEMFEALEAMYDWHCGNSCKGPMHSAARAAIAKAEGEEIED